MRGKRDARPLGIVGLSLLVQCRLLLFKRGDDALTLDNRLFGLFVVCLLFAHVASYQERRLVQPPGGHQPAVDLISPLAPMYGRHGSS